MLRIHATERPPTICDGHARSEQKKAWQEDKPMRKGKYGKNTHGWITRYLSPGSRFLGKLERVAGPQVNGNKNSVARNM